MKAYFSNEFFLIALTFGSYFLGKLLRRKTGWVVMNPILVSIATVITFLWIMDISYETYNKGGQMIEFWLRPAVVALGVPLYLQLSRIKRQLVPILLCELAGCVVGIVSVVWIASEMGASREVILSLAPKSVTTPIAMEVTNSIGGIPSLTAAVVVCVGLFCAVCGYKTMGFARVRGTVAQGLSMGTAAHALGTATSMDRSRIQGAYASLGLTLNGILTSLLTPCIIPMLNV
ncbi:MAG: LrgB family protein [Alloprevotella sp.]